MTKQECVVCTRTAYVFCESCATLDENGVPLDARFYCTPLCQDIDRLSHNEKCAGMANDKELVERANLAGDIVQALFYTFIEHTWAYDMGAVHVTPSSNSKLLTIGVMHVPINTGSKDQGICERIAGGWLIKFPHDSFKSADRKVKRALLADRHSIWAFVVMHIAVQILFEDLVDNIERDIKEIVHYLPGHAWRIVKHQAINRYLVKDREDLPYPDEDRRGVLKGVYCITLKNGAKVALDLAGAQYSLIHDTVMPWTEYCERWVNDLKYRLPLHSHYTKHNENMNYLRSETHLSLITEQLACFNGLLRNCEHELGFDLKDLPSEDIHYFRDSKHRLTVSATNHLLQRPRDLDDELASKNKYKNPITNELDCFPGNLGDMKYFDWSKLVEMIKIPGNKVSWREKKRTKLLLKFRCAYKLPADWRLIMCEGLPGSRMLRAYISENPFFGKRK